MTSRLYSLTRPALRKAEDDLLEYAIEFISRDNKDVTRESLQELAEHWQGRQAFLDLTCRLG